MSAPRVRLRHQPLLHPLAVSHTRVLDVDVIEVTVPVAGATGVGEVSVGPWDPAGGPEVASAAGELLDTVAAAGPADAAALAGLLGPVYGTRPAAATLAVEMAWLDGLSRAAGLPLHAYLGLPAPAPLPLFTTVDLDEAGTRPWERRPGRYKVKLGGPADDRVVASCAAATGSQFLFDANSGWDRATYARLRPLLTAARPLALEDPLRDPADLAALRPRWRDEGILLDESVRSVADVAAVAGDAAGVNLKLLKTGGLLPAAEAARIARRGGSRVLIGSFVEPPRAVAYAAHLLGLADLADLDGDHWISGARRTTAGLAPGPGIGELRS